MIKEDLQILKKATTRKVLRSFGFTIGGLLLAIAAFLYWREHAAAIYFAVSGGLLALAGLVIPMQLKQLYWGWMSIALVIGFFMTRIILSIFYYLVFTPAAMIAKILGKDLIDAAIDKNATSYWRKRPSGKYDATSTENQY